MRWCSAFRGTPSPATTSSRRSTTSTSQLGADETGKVTDDYGVWVEKSMYGKKYMGIERATYLIDGKGVIRGIWRKVKVDGHVDEVLKAVKALD